MSDAVSAILQYVKDSRKLDFSVYRPDTIRRRLEQRMAASGSMDEASYLQILHSNPAEIDKLIAALTITTSHFFRNPLVFDALSGFILPEMFETFAHETLRIWCAGCGRGEEAYSLAILLSSICKAVAKDVAPPTIIATDIDRGALGEASEGRYDAEALREVRKGLFDSYFIEEQGRYRVADEIRSMVHFVYHDITTCSPPKEGIFSDYHLILCRNVLIYFNREIQERVLNSFHESLRRRGCLVLGETEMIFGGDFYELFPRTKIFRKGGRAA